MRTRRNKSEMQDWRSSVHAIVQELKPATVRQVFYQCTVRGLCDKTEAAYKRVAHTLAELRKSGAMPYTWLADATRWMRKPRCADSLLSAIEATAQLYRRDAMSRAERYIEVWLEKEALAGVVADVTAEFDAPLMVARGFASLSFLHSAADTIRAESRPTTVYHLGDWDPSGQHAARATRDTLLDLSGRADMQFISLAVRPWQIEQWNLPTRPTKRAGNTHAKGWDGDSVELDAIHPDTLREIVRTALAEHIPAGELAALRAAEQSEREALAMFGRELGTYRSPASVIRHVAERMAADDL